MPNFLLIKANSETRKKGGAVMLNAITEELATKNIELERPVFILIGKMDQGSDYTVFGIDGKKILDQGFIVSDDRNITFADITDNNITLSFAYVAQGTQLSKTMEGQFDIINNAVNAIELRSPQNRPEEEPEQEPEQEEKKDTIESLRIRVGELEKILTTQQEEHKTALDLERGKVSAEKAEVARLSKVEAEKNEIQEGYNQVKTLHDKLKINHEEICGEGLKNTGRLEEELKQLGENFHNLTNTVATLNLAKSNLENQLSEKSAQLKSFNVTIGMLEAKLKTASDNEQRLKQQITNLSKPTVTPPTTTTEVTPPTSTVTPPTTEVVTGAAAYRKKLWG